MGTEGSTSVDAERLQQFAMGVRGRVLQPGDSGYDEARAVRNGLIDRRPALIVQCAGTADVVDAVDFAREQRLVVSIRGGAHNVAGNAVNDGGMVIDLSAMRAVHVDPEHRTARVQGGATWGDVDRETQLWGLAAPGGQVSTTGVAGLTLHGGLGSLHRRYGLALDNLRSVEIVTADGQVRTASESVEPELFWAVRGAGSNFGVVTSFEFVLHPVGPEIYQAAPIFSLDEAPAVLRRYRDFCATAPDEMGPQAMMWSVPAVDDFPAELHGMPILVALVVYSGDPEEGERLLRPVLDWGTPIMDLSGRAPYTLAQSSFDSFFPSGGYYYWKSLLVGEPSDDLLDAIVDVAADRPSPDAIVNFWQLGGAIDRVAPDATAFAQRDARYLLSLDTSWFDPAATERCIDWTRKTWAAMQHRFATDRPYLNFVGFGEEKEALVRASYGTNYERLVAAKTTYDPGNLFHMNNNIAPIMA
jgi:FAD/FMN-containing dehydrogenase